MNITLNGNPATMENDLTVSGLVSKMGFKGRAIAVEINGELVPREQFDRLLADGDQVEVVTLVGGG
ncbi:MAG: sulfur carrier protein ThiS [Planctomycetota bacterium]